MSDQSDTNAKEVEEAPVGVSGDDSPVESNVFDADEATKGQDEALDGSPNDRVDEVLGNVAPAGSEEAPQGSEAAAGDTNAAPPVAEPQGAPQPS